MDDSPAVCADFVFESQAVNAAKKLARYFVIAGALFLLWDLYAFVRHGHIIGAFSMALVCWLLAVTAYSFKGTVRLNRAFYRSEYRLAGWPFQFEYSLAQYPVLHIEYDCLYSQVADKHPVALQFVLLPHAKAELAYGVAMTADISFERTTNPAEVACFIKRIADVTELELSWGLAARRSIYPAYQLLCN